MRKIIFVLLLLLSIKGFSQQEKIQAVRNLILNERPDLDLGHKLIFISSWSVNDQSSRGFNKELARAVRVYGQAKLKGGRRGLCGILIDETDDVSMARIVAEKDGFTNLYLSDISRSKIDYSFTKNILVDGNGTILAKDLNESEVYTIIQSQLTR